MQPLAKIVSCPQLNSSCLLYLKTGCKFAVEEAECESLFACFFETELHSVALAGLQFTMYSQAGLILSEVHLPLPPLFWN